jgi:hypothetical protein
MNKLTKMYVGGGALLVGVLASASQAFAAATYDLTPVTTGASAELSSNVPVILGAIGALIALAVGIRLFRRVFKA